MLPSTASAPLAHFLKNELFLSPSYVVDASCINSQQVVTFARAQDSLLAFYIYYFFFLKKRVIFLFPKVKQINSIDSVYPSACWLEREFSEMFGAYITNKIDARNLLLDYSLNENPLLKAYPSVGLREVHYSLLAESVVYSSSAIVEL